MSCNADCHKPHFRQAHCTVCHLTFTGVSNFDDHRVGGECRSPQSIGLTTKDGVWGRFGTRPSGTWTKAALAEADYHDYPHKENQ